jgi:hypothetical protein
MPKAACSERGLWVNVFFLYGIGASLMRVVIWQVERDAFRKRVVAVAIAAGLSCAAVSAQPHRTMLDHFAVGEVVPGLRQGASCAFSDRIGVVFHSNWQRRHWIKAAGAQVELDGEAQMSEAGWYQTFESGEVTVTLQLQRVLPEPLGSDGVRLAGEIVIVRSGRSTQYEVSGRCGA